ncbi:diamine N-acetyltransferase [Chitinophaga skermanii]|uniref:Diamine N-acetyltransferase n=1 Tax=Chitinophaga skermanii TaxID=331697 RepID=A0A327Q6S3_9BACT|nr:GNAT family N-acetyltransferase [Chitinophaga skermanii]RAI99684.1 diamine N-acetyltransferase [Chitinophaga skermanii]
MHIRIAEPRDYPRIIALIQEFAAFIGTPGKVSVTVESMERDQAIFNGLVAEENGDIIGFATYFFAYYSWSGKALYLDDLFVQETYRGRNIGTQLFDQVLTIARSQGCVKMRWQVSRWNEAAKAFYVKRGAVLDEVEMNCDINFNEPL